MISFYLLWTGCYFVLLGWLSKKWPKNSPKTSFKSDFPEVTLIIPFRNERENLDSLVNELRKLDYPDLQILLIDDQSEDGSYTLLKENVTNDSRIITIKSPGIGKKKALEYGVELAKSELILCSDADCKFPDQWIQHMISPFANSSIQLVAGPVISDGQTSFFQRFQQIDWSSILLLTQFYFSQKQPLMCSGANLAYRKSAFMEVGGYAENLHYLSGDDEFLLKKISSHFGKESCAYVPFVENLVSTKPHASFFELQTQRIRWASKWRLHQDPGHAFAAAFSFFSQLIWICSVVLLGVGWAGFVAFFGIWSVKIFAERIALGKVLTSFKFRVSFLDFVKTGIIHPFYVIFVALGAFWGKYTWKGRGN